MPRQVQILVFLVLLLEWVDLSKYSIKMGCSLETYRARIGIFGKTVKGKEVGEKGHIRKEKSYTHTSKGMFLLLIWYSINIVMAPHIISMFEVGNLRAIHPAGRTPPVSSPSFCLAAQSPPGMKHRLTAQSPTGMKHCLTAQSPPGIIHRLTAQSPKMGFPGIHPAGRTQTLSSHPLRTEQQIVAHKIPYL